MGEGYNNPSLVSLLEEKLNFTNQVELNYIINCPTLDLTPNLVKLQRPVFTLGDEWPTCTIVVQLMVKLMFHLLRCLTNFDMEFI